MTTITTTITTKTCDMPHDSETPATTTRNITIDGRAYEIDVCDFCNYSIDSVTGAVLKYARPVKRSKRNDPPRRTAARRQRSATIRRWWHENPDVYDGPVRDKGRIPADVIRAHDAMLRDAA